MTEWPFQRVSRCGFAALFLVVSSSFGFGQVIVTSATATVATASPAMIEFTAEQIVLDQSLNLAMAQNATSDSMSSWMTQNQAALQAQAALAVELGAEAGTQPLAYITSVPIPDNASQDLGDFLTTEASLLNLQAQIHNQLLQQGTDSSANEGTLFQQQAGATIQAQQQLAQTITAEGAEVAIPSPPPLVIPANASTTLQAYLTLADQLSRGEIAVRNANLQVDPATQDAALVAWRQANTSQFQQLQVLAQELGGITTNQQEVQ